MITSEFPNIMATLSTAKAQPTPENITLTTLCCDEGMTTQVWEPTREGVTATQLWKQADIWLWTFCPPVLFVLGVSGNLATVVTLRRVRSAWSAISVYLTALAVTDTMVLSWGLAAAWVKKIWARDMYSSHSVLCKLSFWVMTSCASISSWFIVALTLQRAASVVWPHKVNVVCTRQKTVAVIVVVSVLLASVYSHMLYGLDVVKIADGVPEICAFGDAAYGQFWGQIWTRVDVFLYSVVPSVILVLGNSVLAWKLAESTRWAKKKLSGGTASQSDDRQKKVSSATVTVMAVSLMFLCLSLPFMIFVNIFYTTNHADPELRAFYQFLYELFFMIWSVNSVMNFYLYILTGGRFRGEFVKMLRCGHERRQHQHPLSCDSKFTGVSTSHLASQQNVNADTEEDF